MTETKGVIYQVFNGEAYEGGQVVASFYTKEEAIIFADEWIKYNWRYNEDRTVEERPFSWTNGCDYLQINKVRIYSSWKEGARWLNEDHPRLPQMVIPVEDQSPSKKTKLEDVE